MRKNLSLFGTAVLALFTNVYANEDFSTFGANELLSSNLDVKTYYTITVDLPTDPPNVNIDDKCRRKHTTQYLNSIDELYKRNSFEILNKINPNTSNFAKELIPPSTILNNWLHKSEFFGGQKAELPCMVLDRDVVADYLNTKDSDDDTGKERLKMVTPEYSLILGNAVNVFTQTITTINSNNPTIKEIKLCATTKELYEFINTKQ